MNITKRNTREVSEKEYRSLKDVLSYSALKTFAKDRNKFFKEFVLGEKKEEALSNDMILGNLADCEFFTPEEFDTKFHINAIEKPTGQMGELCDDLLARTSNYVNSEGECTVDFTTIFTEAVENQQKKGSFKGKDINKILTLFTTVGSDGFSPESYYEDGRKAIGKTVVDINQVTYSKKLVENVLNSPFEAGEILRATSTNNVDVLNQLVIFFSIEGIKFKAMLDRVIISYNTKTIKPYDLKVTWESENFDYNFLKMYYYIQNSVYNLAIREYTKQNGLEDYTIDYLSFIALDSSGKSEPLVYETDESIFELGLNGFTTSSGKRYLGVLEIIKDINHHLSTGNWQISRKAHENNGVLDLKIDLKK